MTERERLIGLLHHKYNHFCDQCGVNKRDDYVETLADYLLKNGVIVPPCKVGDTVYQIANGWRICESKITWFYWDKFYKRIIYDCNTDLAFSEEAIGKSVFLSKEEAENALKAREK